MKRLLYLLACLPLMTWAQDGVKPIIDMHLHDYTPQSYYVAPAPDGEMAPSNYADYKKEVDSLLKKYNVEKAVVSTIGGPTIIQDTARLIPGYFTESPPKDTVAFKKLIASGKLKVFGEIGAIYGGYTLSDPKFEPFLAICERYDIPVAVHTGGGAPGITYRGSPNFRLYLGDPFTVEDVLAKHPRLRIYLMHSGEVFYKHAIRLMEQYPQLYTDLGVILWIDKQPMYYGKQFLKEAKQFDLLDRVMFGSDEMVWPKGIEKSIKTLDSYSFLTEEDKRKIFYENAARFLRLNIKTEENKDKR